ncbi:SufE family protein [Rhodobium gokarnense]|uniref:Cysteine desulfuration protein SufE n=1 Tax=Rhodobium gokarnense TaxID=364296 RepID=A0ABT3HBZ1_9HYPH|nr:SufE family protein [Rhodobium gokarnense]MCW2307916.1 cysteine desulfuration protein SufE [Rhodobium gokarnense]
MQIDDIVENFELLDDWEDRYRYVIELGKELEPLPDDERTEANKVHGCTSQVWLATHLENGDGTARLTFRGDSDAHIVRGLIAILFAQLSGQTAPEILDADPAATFQRIGLSDHLTPQRANGLNAMIARIRKDAAAAAA